MGISNMILTLMFDHHPHLKSKVHLQIVGGASGNGIGEPEKLKASTVGWILSEIGNN